LRLTGRDIGSYLGMTLETVSRLFSRFQAKGLVKIEKSLVRILDLPGLKAMGRERGS